VVHRTDLGASSPMPAGVRGANIDAMDVLVAYASCHGSTAGIAERLAARIGAHGATTAVRRVDTVESLDGIDAVVLGAPVYDQSWPPEALEFVRTRGAECRALPLWLFSVGSFGDSGRPLGLLTHKEPRGIDATLETLRPREYRVFRGVIRKHQWPFWSRLLFHLFGGRFGDHRDWSAIEGWGDEIGTAVCGAPARQVANEGSP
jgi:menaquinone-dependent protoporphyrinogen oxidase